MELGTSVRFVYVRMGEVYQDEGVLVYEDDPWLRLRLAADEVVVIHTDQVRVCK
tara:strand:+ start:401 stop:562 length:162 start_codon:yes stop_codon:yes gene_type:complete